MMSEAADKTNEEVEEKGVEKDAPADVLPRYLPK